MCTFQHFVFWSPVVTPYRKNSPIPADLAEPVRLFHWVHAKTRNIVERMLGQVKGRFTQLEALRVVRPLQRAQTVQLAFGLHNLIRLARREFPSFLSLGSYQPFDDPPA